MTDLQTDTQTDEHTNAAPAGKRKRRWFARNNRKGLGTTEMALVAVVIVVVGILAGLGLSRMISFRQTAERSALQTNIETVGHFVDTYWQQFAADNVGRRKLSPVAVCQYINSQLTGSEVAVRTMQFVTGAGVPVALDATNTAATAATAAGFGLIDDAENLKSKNRGEDIHASCPNDGNDLAKAYADILIGSAAAITALGDVDSDSSVTGFAVPGGTADDDDWDTTTTPATGAINAAERAEAIEQVGLESTTTVWIAFPGSAGALSTAGFSPGTLGNLPAGTDGTFLADDDNHKQGVEYIVIGGIAVDGTSYCMVKVLDAAANADLGNYYKSAEEGTAGADNSFITCLDGIRNATQVDWPEPS